MAERLKDHIDIAASVKDIFAVATDFESYPEWNTSIKRVEVREIDEDGLATKVWYEVDAKLKTLTYTLGYDYSGAPDAFSWALLEGDVRELNGSYVFDAFDDVTEVTYELAVDLGFPVPGFLKRQGQRQILKGGLQELKKRVESR